MFLVFFVFYFSLPRPSSATRKGFWITHTCVCSVFLSYKTLIIFLHAK